MKANGLHLTTKYATSAESSYAELTALPCWSLKPMLCISSTTDYPGHEEGLCKSGDILCENLNLDKQCCITSIKGVRQRPIPPGHLAQFPSH